MYFGEDLSGYVVIGTKRKEIDYSGDNGTVYTTYNGRRRREARTSS